MELAFCSEKRVAVTSYLAMTAERIPVLSSAAILQVFLIVFEFFFLYVAFHESLFLNIKSPATFRVFYSSCKFFQLLCRFVSGFQNRACANLSSIGRKVHKGNAISSRHF